MRFEIRDWKFEKSAGSDRAFTLVEVLVGTALFLVVALAFYGSFTSLFQLASGAKARTLAVELADEQFEIVRNMPYKNVGLTNGIPHGVLAQNQTLSRGGFTFDVHLTIRNINLSTSTVQASDKLVEVEVTCPTCKNYQPVVLTGQISPANLQSAGDGGALVAQVFDGSGQPVIGATVDMQSIATSSITNNDVTNNEGILNVIGVPPGTNMYRIIVSKPGYSTERTYPIGEIGNPDPIKPDVTIADQQVSPVSFSIDKLSSISFTSVTPLCVPVGSFDFVLSGTKQIGDGVLKYTQNLATDASGRLDLTGMEWDTYTVSPIDPAYDVAGMNPFSPFALNPDNAQSMQMVVVPKDPNGLMVSVIDNASGLPISGASVELSTTGYDETFVTGEGYISQTDWSEGGGQVSFSNPAQYWSDNGKIDTATSTGNVVLKQIFGEYDTVVGGLLESSIFDTGTTSNYYTLSWTPLSQPPLTGPTSLKFQFASSASSTDAIWSFVGPDGTAGSFYEIPGSPINISHNGKRFARYAAYLTTATATVTPALSDVSFSYTSGCIPPGQVLFQGLSTGSYNLTVSKAGYTSYSGTVEIADGWQENKVLLSIQ